MALLEVNDLQVSFVTRMGTNKAVDGISFSVDSGRITAIILERLASDGLALDRDGSLLDDDKGMWQQCRFTWLLGELFNGSPIIGLTKYG